MDEDQFRVERERERVINYKLVNRGRRVKGKRGRQEENQDPLGKREGKRSYCRGLLGFKGSRKGSLRKGDARREKRFWGMVRDEDHQERRRHREGSAGTYENGEDDPRAREPSFPG